MTHTLSDLARHLASGQMRSQQLVQSCLAAISAQNQRLHAFNRIFADQALAAAVDADSRARRGERIGPLHGIPFAVKDLADIAGHEPGFGSRCYNRGVAEHTATAIQRLEAAGAILIGTTHLVEFAIGSWGTNSSMGTPRNPCDDDHHRVPGGSSSGSAVAVAAGLVPFAIGSDTGGSVRIPASLCGVVGMKPSCGRISLGGIAQLSATFDTLGPLTSTAADAALVSDVMASMPPSDADPVLPPVVGFVPLDQLDPIDAEISAAYAELLQGLRRQGVMVVPLELPRSPADYQSRNGRIVAYEIHRRLGHLAMDPTKPIDPHVRRRVLEGARVTPDEYHELLLQRASDIRAIRSAMRERGILLAPTTPITARRIDEVDELAIPLLRFIRIANYLDLVSISLPLPGLSRPAGVQLMGLSGDDKTVTDAACAFEKIILETFRRKAAGLLSDGVV
ncbi:amidase [Paracoccus benzoatiresistens]|uniref:Amidase n=1 Tax=Paracoccus benzoatiresistens TaxID=2997341 RepID=A0ABT4J811_9RHOB|nr:amidase [Paracoccus sp. EF6]MCZ0962561.1 amidase [Paracoccus sp. EF6]